MLNYHPRTFIRKVRIFTINYLVFHKTMKLKLLTVYTDSIYSLGMACPKFEHPAQTSDIISRGKNYFAFHSERTVSFQVWIFIFLQNTNCVQCVILEFRNIECFRPQGMCPNLGHVFQFVRNLLNCNLSNTKADVSCISCVMYI